MDAETLKSYLVKLGFSVDQAQFAQFESALKRNAKSVDDHVGLLRKKFTEFAQHWQGLFTRLGQAFSKQQPGGGQGGVLGQFLKLFGGAEGAAANAGGLFKGITATTGALSKFSAVAAIAVEAAKLLVKAQFAIIGGFTAVSVAVVGVIDRVAMADQKYRLLGRRMFMTTEQARTLQRGMDALGASMGEIAWDPELRGQFFQLAADREANWKRMGADYEANMRKFRQVRFEIIRFKENLADLVRFAASAILRAFGTDLDGALEKLRGFNQWFMQKMPQIADFLADVFQPVLRETGAIWKELGGLLQSFGVLFTNTMALLSGDRSLETKTWDAKKFGEALRTLAIGLENGLHWAADFANAMTRVESAIIGVLSWLVRLAGTVRSFFHLGSGDDGNAPAPGQGNIRQKVMAEAQRQGVDPRLALAVGDHESGLRQFDKNGQVMAAPGSSARGVFQLLKGTASALGVDRLDADQNIRGGVKYLKQLYAKYGDWKTALEAYYAGPGYVDAHRKYNQAIEPKYERYADSILAKAQHMQVDVGGVNVNITQPGASAQEIQRAVTSGIRDSFARQTQRNLAQLVYAS